MNYITEDTIKPALDAAWEQFQKAIAGAVLEPEQTELAQRVINRMVEYGVSAALLSPADRFRQEMAIKLDLSTLDDIGLTIGINAATAAHVAAMNVVKVLINSGVKMLAMLA